MTTGSAAASFWSHAGIVIGGVLLPVGSYGEWVSAADAAAKPPTPQSVFSHRHYFTG